MKHHSNGDDRRSLERVSMRADKAVYLQANVDGSDVAMLVENLSAGGATLIYPEDSDSLLPGKRLQECTLDLGGTGCPSVTAIIRWRIWPKFGIQFENLSNDARAQIERFLQENR
jgi:c-di-GMP-binding flagellar brake protein YcgR